jgi:lipopolysaccharide export system permease protein
MNWSMTLNAYLARRFGAAVLMVFTAIALLGMSIDLAELFRRTTDKDIPTAIVFSMSLLKLPDLAQKLLPFAVLFGAIIAFARLSRNHELVATRAAGISVWQFLAMPLLVALFIGIVTATIFNPVSAALLAQYARMEARHIQGQASQLDVSSAGLWLRQGSAADQSVIHALRVADQGTHLEDVMVLLYDGVDRFSGRIDAASADLEEGSWRLSEAWISNQEGQPVYHAAYRMPTDLTAAQIEESFASPSTISFWDLPRFIATAESAGFSALRHRIYWYSLLALPILLAAMVIVAAGFSFRLARLGGMTQLLFLGALAGLGVYFLQDVTQAMALGGILPPPLAALAPSLGAIFLGTALLLHEEDG